MNSVIDTMLSHRSIRQYTDEPIAPEQLNAIIQSGIAASSSSMLQVVSVIRITDPEKRKALARLAGNQAYVEKAAEFLVFCIDYQRHFELNPEVTPEYTELTLIGAIDSGIMAQNCLLAAESLGLGGVYIGGLRNGVKEADELLGLPKYSAALFGLCLGHPAQDPEIKPRLAPEVLVHENQYQPLNKQQVAKYDDVMASYYASRTSNQKQSSWSEQVTSKISGEVRPHILGYLNSKGLAKK